MRTARSLLQRVKARADILFLGEPRGTEQAPNSNPALAPIAKPPPARFRSTLAPSAANSLPLTNCSHRGLPYFPGAIKSGELDHRSARRPPTARPVATAATQPRSFFGTIQNASLRQRSRRTRLARGSLSIFEATAPTTTTAARHDVELEELPPVHDHEAQPLAGGEQFNAPQRQPGCREAVAHAVPDRLPAARPGTPPASICRAERHTRATSMKRVGTP